jgi:hypothetical protein
MNSTNAVAMPCVNSTAGLRPRRPAMQILNSIERVPGAFFHKKGNPNG